MAKYKLLGINETYGVFDNENKLTIPNSKGNRHWQEYLNWKLGKDANGNSLPGNPGEQVPDSQFDLLQIKENKKNELKNSCNNFINSGYIVNIDLGSGLKDYKYDSELKDQINILGAIQQDLGNFPIDFTCVDVSTGIKGRYAHSAANMDKVYNTGVNIMQIAKAQLYSLYSDVDNAVDENAVEIIKWTNL